MRLQAAFALGSILERVAAHRQAYLRYMYDRAGGSHQVIETSLAEPLAPPHTLMDQYSAQVSAEGSVTKDLIAPLPTEWYWLSDEVWTSFIKQCCALLDGSDKPLASLARCLGLLGMGLSPQHSPADKQLIVEVLTALKAKLLLKSGKKAVKQEGDLSLLSTSLSEGTDETIQKCLQVLPKKVVFAITQSLNALGKILCQGDM